MIKFFRRIRQRLLSENKFSKYLFYAIGEIILVVIGILIALQINNWNESKKDRAFEVKMLKEVRSELIQDTIYFNLMKERVQAAIEGAQKMMVLYAEERPSPDSLTKYGRMMATDFKFIYHKGSYEAIKSTGIDKISNDSIRLSLTDMYDFKMPRAKIMLENTNATEISDMDYFNLFVDIEFLPLPNGKVVPKLNPKTNIGENKKIADIIFEKLAVNSNAVTRLDEITSSCENFLKLLDRELGTGILSNTYGDSEK